LFLLLRGSLAAPTIQAAPRPMGFDNYPGPCREGVPSPYVLILSWFPAWWIVIGVGLRVALAFGRRYPGLDGLLFLELDCAFCWLVEDPVAPS
jgi:hypothetical protein